MTSPPARATPTERASRARPPRRRALVAALPLLLLAGYAVPRWLIPSGVERWRADPLAAAVARDAYAAVWALNDNPLGRLLVPGARVTRVWRDPGHCPPGEPGGREPTADWRAEARTHGWFGVPGPTVEVTCGGRSYGLRRAGAAPTPGAAAAAAIDSPFTVAGRTLAPARVNAYLAERLGFTSRGGVMRCAYRPLGQEGARVFVETLCLELVREADTLAQGSGRGGPVALRVAAEGDSVRVVSHEVPMDGGGYAASVRRIFPRDVAERIFAGPGERRPGALERHLRAAAAPPRLRSHARGSR
jgi:hypothetical protein